jgi:hypothetical protein
MAEAHDEKQQATAKELAQVSDSPFHIRPLAGKTAFNPSNPSASLASTGVWPELEFEQNQTVPSFFLTRPQLLHISRCA